MTLVCDSVLCEPGDAVTLGNVLRGDSEWQKSLFGLLMLIDSLGASRILVQIAERHRLDATTDADLDLAGRNLIGNRGNSLQAGGAEAIDRIQWHRVGDAREELGGA